MSDILPNIKTIVIKVITDKPVRKTPYQVKGVIMRKHADATIVPMLNGSYRNKFLYPRVQVKILNEQIYIIGVNEGIDPIIALSEKLKELDFGNITFSIDKFEIEEHEKQFIFDDCIFKYRFITPWVALNKVTSSQYRLLNDKKKEAYLNKLLGHNLIFITNEMGVSLSSGVYAKVKTTNLNPEPVDDNKWKAFLGEFKTNLILPSYIGLGNGITRGFGSIYKESDSEDQLLSDQDKDLIFTLEDFKKKKKKFKSQNRLNKKKSRTYFSKNKNRKRQNNSSNKFKSSSSNPYKSKNEKLSPTEDDSGNDDDQRFNTERHHKQQHKF